MGAYELYLLKSVTALSFLYIFYWIALRNETYYSWNRIFLLTSLVIAFVFPMFSFSIRNVTFETYTNLIEPVINRGFVTSTGTFMAYNSLSILSIIYISGAVFFSLRLLSSLARIHYLYFRFPKYRFNGFKAVVLDGNQSPFTFFNILFISRMDYESGKIDEMIAHEKAHSREFHTFDILLLEVVTIIQWFNPFVWLFRHALKSEHEFVADNKVLLEGFDKVRYQKMLFEKSLGITSFNLTNGFNYSLLKKRLKMMTTSKSSSLVRIKYLLSMPILLMATMLLAINFNSFAQKKKVYDKVDVMPEYKNGGIEGLSKFMQQNIKYPASAREKNVSGKIFVQFIVDENGKVDDVKVLQSKIKEGTGKEIVVVGYKSDTNTNFDSKSVAELEAEAVRVVKLLGDFTPGQKDGKKVNVHFTLPVKFVLDDKKK